MKTTRGCVRNMENLWYTVSYSYRSLSLGTSRCLQHAVRNIKVQLDTPSHIAHRNLIFVVAITSLSGPILSCSPLICESEDQLSFFFVDKVTSGQIECLFMVRGFCYMVQQPLARQDVLVFEDSRAHSDTPHSVGLLWASDQPNAETSTWQNITLKRDRHMARIIFC
jgi:hypothetical protein